MLRHFFSKLTHASKKEELSLLASSVHAMKDQWTHHLETLTQEKQKLSAILSSIYDGVLAIDHQKKILTYNEPILKIFNLGGFNLIGKKISDVPLTPTLIKDIEACLEFKKTYQKQIKITPNTERYFECTISPLLSISSKIIGAVAIFHDISELKKLEHMRVDFVANASHELKTPLSVIRGYADTLLEEEGLKEQTIAFVKTIQEHTHRLTKLVEDLLALSQLETEQTLEKAALDLEALIPNLIHHLSPLAKQKNVSIQTNFKEKYVWANASKLEQALTNLLENSIKYNPSGTNIWILSEKEKEAIRLSIKDTGVGISPEHLPRIFERFYRVDQGRSRECGGTGLGLSIVKHVALLHGGYVDVESTPGQGSTFSLILPLL